ncbi:Zn-ribbon domain-containing OB-fold protein [Candidatus Nitrososphaera gargensis]|uniref:Zn-ribbon domain-containing OB-fold protein n=1 Tax=Candidatus Nitrososphaera gargensis TaxID=497727 RepID=UPI0011E51A82|nr:zinc ribbon domain-containing protein [Candidatus Nitrososphaera gargensis]
MQEFLDHLKKGKFMVPTCISCGSKVWPPSHRCPYCLSKTSLKKIETTGILLEFSSSHIKGKEGVFGLIEMSGIKLIGSFGTPQLKEGMKVKMTRCGVRPDGTAFYSFAPAKA